MRKLLQHQLTRSLDIDDPQTTLQRKKIIQQKAFLRKIYQEWYEWVASVLPEVDGPVLELGSGAGFMDEYIPGLITSEVFFCPIVKVVLDGCTLPFRNNSLRSIVMIDVFHHIPDSRSFLSEAARCIRSGGSIVMIEPWVTRWSQCVYKYLHHEPFDREASEWGFPLQGPLSGANSALPWIVFERDRKQFEKEFAQVSIDDIIVEMPFRYLLSGGVSLRSLMPGFLYGFWSWVESKMSLWNDQLGMFAKIVLHKI